MNILNKLLDFREYPRYLREFPRYLRGIAKARTRWGDDMYVPFPEFRSVVDSGIILGHGEEAVYHYLTTHLSDKDIFFDIGANAGFYTLLSVYKGAETYAFEPFPSTIALLERNTRGKKVHVCPVAVSNHRGTRTMKRGSAPGLNKISNTGTLSVQTITVDELGVIPTVMKIDVEGHEREVFEGARTILTEHSPVVIAEVGEESKAYLESLGYTSTVLGKTNVLFKKVAH
jgi:FkbM family methyltransferase